MTAATGTARLHVATPPWRHQHEAVSHALAAPNGGSMLAIGMGGGKTLTAALIMEAINARLVLIMCPCRIPAVWRKELAKHLAPRSPVDFLALEPNLDGRGKVAAMGRAIKLAAARGRVLVVGINYEAAWRPDVKAFLLKQRWDALFLDESHRIKSPGGKASRCASLFAGRVKVRVALTGTPMPHSLLDVYAQYRAIDPKVFGKSFTAFRARYAVPAGANGQSVAEWQNVAEFERKFHSIAFVRAIGDCVDLPGRTMQTIEVLMSPRAATIYDRLMASFWADVGAGKVTVANAMTRLTRLQQITSGYLPLDDGKGHVEVDDSKAEALRELLTDAPRDRPVVVFCRFHHDLDAVRRITETLELEYAEVSGRQHDLTDDSTIPPRCDVVGVQIRAGGVGVDFTAARIGVFYSVGFSLGDYEQAIGRLDRPGQTDVVSIINLAVAGTIDVDIFDALEARRDTIQAILDNAPADRARPLDA